MLELKSVDMIKFPSSSRSAESIHIVNTLVRFVKADMNQVRGETASEFLARKIANNCIALLDADIGVHMGVNSVRIVFGIISNAKQVLMAI